MATVLCIVTARADAGLARLRALGAMQVIPQVAPLVEAAGGRFACLTSCMGRPG
jgi:hypothetical protein